MHLENVYRILNSFEGATFASLDTETNVTLTGGKKNPYQGRVTKRTSNNQVMLFTNKNSNGYENMVKRRLEAEGKNPESFTVGSLPWGTRIPNTPLIENKDKYYIQMIFNKPGYSEYFLDGVKINNVEEIEGFPKAKDEAEVNGQGLSKDNAVIVRTFALESIKAIRLLGEEIKS